MTTGVQRLTEGALLAALAAVVGLALVPFVGPLGIYVIAQPLLVLTVRRGPRTGVLAGAVATGVIGLAYGPLVGVPLGLAAAVIGVGLGFGIGRGYPALRTVVVAGVGFAVVAVALAAVAALVTKVDPFVAMAAPLAESFNLSADLVARTGARNPQAQALAEQYRLLARNLVPVLRTLLPVLLLFTVVIPTFIAYAIARAVLRRLGHQAPAFPPVLAWRVSRRATGITMVVLLLLLGTTMLAAPRGGPGAALARQAGLLSLNLFLVVQLIYGVQAVLLVLVLMKKRGYSAWMRGLAVFAIYSLVGLPQIGGLLSLVLMYVGFLDSWYDYRRLTRAEAQRA